MTARHGPRYRGKISVMTDPSLTDLFEEYRTGDAQSQEIFLRRLETRLLQMVRRLIGPQIRSLKDSVDLTQSLLLSFHQSAMEGKVEVENDQALDAYLRSMVRHKIANVSDHQKALKRGGGRQPISLDAAEQQQEVPATRPFDPTASMFARVAETIERLGQALDPEEMEIFRSRIAGRSHVEIAAKLGKTPDAVRMTWVRARAKLVQNGVLEEPE